MSPLKIRKPDLLMNLNTGKRYEYKTEKEKNEKLEKGYYVLVSRTYYNKQAKHKKQNLEKTKMVF